MILVCFGTRPEYLKVKPLFKAFDEDKISYRTIFTGQHEDLLKEVLFDYRLHVNDSKNRLNSVFASVLLQSEDIFDKELPKYVLVQGDTTSACAFALSAYHHQIKIIHLESGLRTYDRDNPYPEEVNRQIISRIADIHLCPTGMNKLNLVHERVNGEIYVVGNTSLDNIRNENISVEKTILITLHRRENHEEIKNWFIELEKLANIYEDYEFILPIHPNPNVQKHRGILEKVKVINPLDHNEIIDLIKKSSLIITDSGGIQEEASFLKKRAIICRKTTERPESLGQSGILCKSHTEIKNVFDQAINSLDVIGECPYGDGNSAYKISKIIKQN